MNSKSLILVSITLLLTSCDVIFQNHSARSLDNATKKFASGDYKSAIGLYEKALDGTAKTADIHYQLAVIYDDKLKEPLSALHHFQRYLEFSPSGSHAKEVKSAIKEAKKKLLAGGQALLTQEDSARLKNENLALRKQNVAFQAKSRTESNNVINAQKPSFPGSKSYVVQQGDTLASISRKVYKTSERWKDIQDANFNALEGTNKLKPGQTLILP